jgi:enterochelin esterase-like enzyme
VVDGLPVLDPRNPSVSESNMNAWSVVYVPGAPYEDIEDVPHGTVSEVTYYSSYLKRYRRMHVYTPHGYEADNNRYPVFYLLHGAWDTDDAWHTVGRAGFILDNLIAARKAVPMVVIMPAGHTGPFTYNPASGIPIDEFIQEFQKDIKPYVEEHYRLLDDRDHRAMAGLSMGGAQTLDIAISDLQGYGYIGVYSSGLFELGSRFSPPPTNAGPTWEERHANVLDDASLKSGLHLFWFATGKDDFLVGITRSTVDLFRRHGFNVVYSETTGAHTWSNWRDYLVEFTPLLFK